MRDKDTKAKINEDRNDSGHMVRKRLNALLAKAARKPLAIVCAGAGYGKTRAVYDFIRENNEAVLWIQLSEYDNKPSRFWESYAYAVEQIDKSSADEMRSIGFPDTPDKVNRYMSLCESFLPGYRNRRIMIVLDDFHLIKNPAIIGFGGAVTQRSPDWRCVFLICREFPQINIAGLQARDDVFIIEEEDLNFTESELAEYLRLQGLAPDSSFVHRIFQDTKGWAFSVSLLARALKKSPGYSGYVGKAFKKNIFEMMESEVYNAVSEELKRFLVRLSLIEHLSAELIEALADGGEALLAEFREQSAYIRYDINIDAYLIHHLFLDFLRTKQHLLTEEEKAETYRTAASWCKANGFTMDALDYYERIGDYGTISVILLKSFMSPALSAHAAQIFERASEEAFDAFDLFAGTHAFIVLTSGRMKEFFELTASYEKRFLKLPEDSVLRNHNLGMIYFFTGIARSFMCTVDDRYDFDVHYVKMHECFKRAPLELADIFRIHCGAWISLAGSAKKGAPEEFIEASARSFRHISACLTGVWEGYVELCRGELLFYQGDVQAAKPFLIQAAERAGAYGQHDLVHRALFYTMRIAALQGDRETAEKALGEIGGLVNEKTYNARFISNDIVNGWYGYILRQPEMIPGWLKEGFAPYRHAYFMENFGNQMKARYHYMVKNFPPLLAYIEEMKQRESILFGRVEMLALEACVRYRMKDRAGAFAAFQAAYENAAPNGIVMPFIELGKDMRTMTLAALRSSACKVPKQWLMSVNKRAALYAKYQAAVVSDYEKENEIGGEVTLSGRETEVLRDLYDGLSHSEIAEKLGISVNTVRMVYKSILRKLDAKNTFDVVRAAVERKLI
ncbi:MAG: LuxR C-terminal-related transcriptional regulator [Firmicutes bacterium]|nr:LuxR C-terminal-related transcriptional regulator [Bacillota bacterium]